MARSPRTARILTVAGIIALAVAVSVAAVFLARWQWHRHEVRADEIAAFDAGQAMAAAPLSSVVPDAAADFPDDAKWRTATVSGAFDADSLTWLRNRPIDGQPASHALAWFVTDDGNSLLVDTGWVTAEAAQRPSLPGEHMVLTVTLRPFEEDNGTQGEGATRITPAQMPATSAAEVPGYGVLSEACQEPCGPLPGLAITPLPTLSLGPHLAYSVQWLMLAAAAPIIAFVWIRRELRPTTVIGAPDRRRREPTDEDVEDSL